MSLSKKRAEMLKKYLEENNEIRVNNNWENGEQLNYRRNVIDYLIERLEAFPIQ